MKPKLKKVYFKKPKPQELKVEKNLISTKIDACLFIVLLVLSALVNTMILQLFQNNLDWSLVWKFIFEWHTEIFLLSSSVILVITLWLYSLIGNRYIVVALTFLTSLGIGMATWQKMLNRSEPLYPSELNMVKELPFLISMIDVKFIVLFIVGGTLLGIAVWLVTHYHSKFITAPNRKKSYLLRGILFVLTSFLLIYIGNFNQSGNYLKKAYDPYAYWIPYSQQMNYYNNGFIGGFLYNLKVEAMEQPADYSKAKIVELTKKYQILADETNQNQKTDLTKSNIVYIMNESFSDPLALKGITVSSDPIPTIRQLIESGYGGKILSQGYGGGTANIEFEALTGFSMEPLNPQLTTPYTQLISQKQKFPSIVDFLKKKNYTTTAIHPYNTSMYKRENVYETLGFDQFISETTMPYTETIGNNPYISDKAAYQTVLKQLEGTDTPDFVHLVTMQNHMPYGDKYITTDFTVTGTTNDAVTENYVQDIAYSDEALVEFIAELKKLDENTIIVFWGDHLPSVYGDEIAEQNSEEAMHQTPLLIYQTNGEQQEQVGTISPMYFMNEILTVSNQESSPYYAFLAELKKEVPAFEKNMYYNKETQKWVENRNQLSKSAQNLLKELDLIQYDVTTGKNYSKDSDLFS
ncbi:LTA synthase family protein [Carnobacterium gallinarum]